MKITNLLMKMTTKNMSSTFNTNNRFKIQFYNKISLLKILIYKFHLIKLKLKK